VVEVTAPVTVLPDAVVTVTDPDPRGDDTDDELADVGGRDETALPAAVEVGSVDPDAHPAIAPNSHTAARTTAARPGARRGEVDERDVTPSS